MTVRRVDILYVRARGQGWGPIDTLADLCRSLLPVGTFTTVDDAGEVSWLRKASADIPSRRHGSRALLVLASNPGHLAYTSRSRHWLPGYAVTAAWVIDSFWTDRISRFAKGKRHLDHIFVTDRDLSDEWRDVTRSEVSWLPWGTDTLAVGDLLGSSRTVDLLRVGRQPEVWDQDGRTQQRADTLGLVMSGRPPLAADSRANQRIVLEAMSRAKFVLAFSNLCSPADYTHPTREYLTGRWMDALGAGATVAGVAPKAAEYTLWPGATVEISPDDLDEGLTTLRDKVAAWTSEVALFQHRHARERLDWRWRILALCETLGVSPVPRLLDDLARLNSPLP